MTSKPRLSCMNALIALTLTTLAIVSAPRAFAEEDANIKQSLQRTLSFEFVDTPLTDAIQFLRQLTKVSIVIDPKVVAANPPPINLRVQDMQADIALRWILKLAELECIIKDNVVFVSTPATLKEMAAAEKAAKKGAGGENSDGILRARFATGDMIEVDTAMLKKYPQLATEVLSMVFDPARDEILALNIGRDIPFHIPVDTFIDSAKKICPDAKISFDKALNLVLVTSTDEGDLHKINAIARALRKGGPGPGMMGMEFGGKGPPPFPPGGPGQGGPGGPMEGGPQNPGKNKGGKPGEPMTPPRPPDTAKDQF